MKTNQLAGAMLAMVFFNAAGAAEVKVLSAGALEPGMKAAAAEFQKASGHSVKLTFNTAPQIRKRIADGEVLDVVVAPPAVIDEFSKAGKLGQDRANVGRVGMGVAVRPGAPAPDISSSEALKKSVLDAESLVFNRASTGIYLENLLKKMGVYDQVEKKTTRYDDAAAVMDHVLKGKGREIGFAPITARPTSTTTASSHHAAPPSAVGNRPIRSPQYPYKPKSRGRSVTDDDALRNGIAGVGARRAPLCHRLEAHRIAAENLHRFAG